jgi:hypothetical protein
VKSGRLAHRVGWQAPWLRPINPLRLAMNPPPFFCPNDTCPSRGCPEAGNLVVHDSLKNRGRCKTCHKTFTARNGTLWYRLQTPEQTGRLVLARRAAGGPLPAIVRAFGCEERTGARRQRQAGTPSQRVPERLVATAARALGSVHADAIRVNLQQRLGVWRALAMPVSPRLGRGGACVHAGISA